MIKTLIIMIATVVISILFVIFVIMLIKKAVEFYTKKRYGKTQEQKEYERMKIRDL